MCSEDFHIGKKFLIKGNKVGIILKSTPDYMKVFIDQEVVEFFKVDKTLNTWLNLIPSNIDGSLNTDRTSFLKHYRLRMSGEDIILDRHVPPEESISSVS